MDTKKKKGRPCGRRPVVAIRVHHDLYAELVAEAAARKIPVSEECERRLMLTLQFSRRKHLEEYPQPRD